VKPAGAAEARRQRRVARLAVALTGAAILATTLLAVRQSESPAPAAAAGVDGEVLAVLPFTQDDNAPTDSFGVGIADAIASHLAGVPGLNVRTMSASFDALEGGVGPIEAGRRLKAVAVLAGHYTRSGDRFEVTAQLIDVRSGGKLWEHRLASDVNDLMAVERDVVARTLSAMLPHSADMAQGHGPRPQTRETNAHYLYLLARGKIATWQSQPIPEAVELLEQAIRLDPEYAPAQAALATASANMFIGGLSSEPMWIERAVAAGRRAVFLDDNDPSSHFALGHALLVAGAPVDSARETLRALKLDPRHADALRNMASLLAGSGHSRAVRALRDAARRSDPSIELGWLDVWLAMIDGDYAEKTGELTRDVERRRAAGQSPELPIMQLGFLAFEAGDAAAGLRWSAMLEEVTANHASADMIHLLALSRTGDLSGMRRLIDKNRAYYAQTWDYCDLIGRAFASMSEVQEALEWLDRSAARGNYDLGTWERSEKLDSVRSHPRFQADLAIVRARVHEIVQLAEFAGYM